MKNRAKPQTGVITKDIFINGGYRRYFNPDDKKNPFHKIYGRKRDDVVEIIHGSARFRRILDVGGGRGRLALSLAPAGGRRILLADLSMDMLRQAARKAGRSDPLRPVKADAHHLPFQALAFDLIIGLDLFCHLEKPREALSEFYRVLADGGTLILDSTSRHPWWTLFYPRYLGWNPWRWMKILKRGGIYPGWEGLVKHYSKREFLAFLENAGFQIVRGLDYGPKICPKWHLAIALKRP